MQTFAVIKQFDVIEDSRSGVASSSKISVINQFILQIGEEALGYSIVMAITFGLYIPKRLDEGDEEARANYRKRKERAFISTMNAVKEAMAGDADTIDLFEMELKQYIDGQILQMDVVETETGIHQLY